MKAEGAALGLAIIAMAFAPASRGCASDHELPPLELDENHQRILAGRSPVPKTAADFYFSLPASYFSGVENTPERRSTFIDQTTMSDVFLEARHWFECDGGGFSVTLRLFGTEQGPLVAIHSSSYPSEVLHRERQPKNAGLVSVTLARPRFWRYRDGTWVAVDDSILPSPGLEEVLERYHVHHKAHLNFPTQQKYIHLCYKLVPKGNLLRVTGRENFMNPSEEYTWARFAFDGTRFERIDAPRE